VLVVALMWVPNGMVNIFLNVYMDRSLAAPSALIGAWLAVAQALMVLGALTIPWWVGRWGRFGSIVATLGIPALGFVLLALVPQLTVVGASQALAKAAAGIAMTILTVYSLEAVAPEWRTMMSGAMNLAVGFGYSAIALVGGYVIVGWGYAALFVGGVAAAAASSVLFWAYFRVPRGEHRVTPAPAP
jgi:MFS family permease